VVHFGAQTTLYGPAVRHTTFEPAIAAQTKHKLDPALCTVPLAVAAVLHFTYGGSALRTGRNPTDIKSAQLLAVRKRRHTMATYLAFHEVDDVDHWLSSPKREEVFGPLGITARTFKDPQGSKRVGMIVEIPDFAAFQQFMQTEPAAEAMKDDGVHPDTLVILAEG
jgi:hypothetical protein